MIHIFSKHDVLSHITSDYEFISNFFKSLEMVLDMKLYFTSRYHLKGDSQMECTNQILEQYLCIYYNYQQNIWLDLLSLIEFVYNNTSSVITSMLLFFTNKEYYLNITIYLERDIISFYTYKSAVNLDELQNALKFKYLLHNNNTNDQQIYIELMISKCIQNSRTGFPSRTTNIY